MQFKEIFTTLIALTFVDSAKIKLEKLIPLCSKSDPAFNGCVKNSGNTLIKQLADGIRDYGIFPADPLKIQFLDLSKAEKSIGLKLNISDSVHTGIRRITIKDAKIDGAKYHLDLDIPQYSITGICDIEGKVLLLPISGHGFCNLTAYEMTATIDMKLKEVPKKGKNYYETSMFDFEIVNTKAKFLLTGLFGGNKQLGDTMNRFLNENSQEVVKELKSTLNSVWTEIYKSMVNRLFANVPVEELYKP